jgi:hypothetical protein
MRVNQFRDFPGTSKRAVYPDVSFGNFVARIVAGGSSHVIKHGIDPTFPATIPISDFWLTGTKPIFSWSIGHSPSGHPGAVLKVESSYDGSGVWEYQNYFIGPEAPSYMEGLYIPGFAVRFTLINSSASVSMTVSGTIRQQGCE